MCMLLKMYYENIEKDSITCHKHSTAGLIIKLKETN